MLDHETEREKEITTAVETGTGIMTERETGIEIGLGVTDLGMQREITETETGDLAEGILHCLFPCTLARHC